MPAPNDVDLDDPVQAELSSRIALAWRDLRRGAAMVSLRDQLFSTPNGTLEPGQVDTLELIVQRPTWRMSDLADALRIDPSTATRAVQRMVVLGLAERHPSREDGRVVMVSATPEGLAWHAHLVRTRRDLMRHLLGQFDPDERTVFAEFLERFVAALDTVTPFPEQSRV